VLCCSTPPIRRWETPASCCSTRQRVPSWCTRSSHLPSLPARWSCATVSTIPRPATRRLPMASIARWCAMPTTWPSRGRTRRSRSSITSRPSRRRYAWQLVARPTAWRQKAWHSKSAFTRDSAALLPRNPPA
jgi:thymidylate kinase (EC 2.7.4.9)